MIGQGFMEVGSVVKEIFGLDQWANVIMIRVYGKYSAQYLICELG